MLNSVNIASCLPSSRFWAQPPSVWTAMSSKSSSSLAQARRLVQQLRREACIERIKVCFYSLLSTPLSFLDQCVDWLLCRCPRHHQTSCATVESMPRMTHCLWASPPQKTLSKTRSLALCCRGTSELWLLSISVFCVHNLSKGRCTLQNICPCLLAAGKGTDSSLSCSQIWATPKNRQVWWCGLRAQL